MEKPRVNGMIIISIIINLVLSIFFFSTYQEEYSGLEGFITVFFAIMIIFCICSIVGALLIQTKFLNVGTILVIVGCALFVPIGLIGVYGAKKIRDQIKEEEFIQNKNRRLESESGN